MKPLPKTVLIKNNSEGLVVGAIRTSAPFLVGRCITLDADDVEGMADKQRQIDEGTLIGTRIRGFSIFVIASGCLVGGCDDADALPILEEMAELIRSEELMPFSHKWKRYALDRTAMLEETRKARQERRTMEAERRIAALEKKIFGE